MIDEEYALDMQVYDNLHTVKHYCYTVYLVNEKNLQTHPYLHIMDVFYARV